MAKRDEHKQKLQVAVTGEASALRHNPFAALSASAAPGDRPVAADTPADAAATPDEARSARAAHPGRRVILRREKKHRGGKAVIVVAGLRMHAHLTDAEISTLAQQLKQQLGCGGAVETTADDAVLILQGDQAARVAEALRGRGFRVDGVIS